jgi:hypothetical protein
VREFQKLPHIDAGCDIIQYAEQIANSFVVRRGNETEMPAGKSILCQRGNCAQDRQARGGFDGRAHNSLVTATMNAIDNDPGNIQIRVKFLTP